LHVFATQCLVMRLVLSYCNAHFCGVSSQKAVPKTAVSQNGRASTNQGICWYGMVWLLVYARPFPKRPFWELQFWHVTFWRSLWELCVARIHRLHGVFALGQRNYNFQTWLWLQVWVKKVRINLIEQAPMQILLYRGIQGDDRKSIFSHNTLHQTPDYIYGAVIIYKDL
jgi:hypothetical protein